VGFIKVDEKKCKKDGICVRECPFGLIRLSTAGGFPEMILGGEDICTLCGHCVTVCPHAALDHERVRFEFTSPIQGNLTVDEAQAVQFLRSRRSVRVFETRPVEKERVIQLIEAARYAPTAGNRQTVHWLVHTGPTMLNEIAADTVEWMREALRNSPSLAKASPYLPNVVSAWDSGRNSILWNAPVLIVASARKEAAFGLIDVTIALSYLDLLAPTMGLGTCWAGLFQGALLASPSLREKTGIPSNHSHHYPMMLGYPAIRHHRLPPRKPPKIAFM
jgi:nitroreductase/NAD-dependent dihydropyrimidine dehydrogenase PreA subunit